MKIAIGTAQFGLDYGISNNSGQTPPEEVKKILNTASNAGISYIDTAYLYGNSEEVIGKSLPANHNFKIITKTAKNISAEILEKNLKESITRLRQDKIYGLLFHNADDLINSDKKLSNKLDEFKEINLIEKVGASVYTGEQIDKVLEQSQIDIIQLPVNVLDQRLIYSGHLKKLKDKDVEIHARSIFLQGLLLMDYENINDFFAPIKTKINNYFDFLEHNGITKLEGALSFVKNTLEVDYLVCGVNNNKQLMEIICAYNENISLNLNKFSCPNETYIDPVNWTFKK